jgi:hypothetical protein
MASQTVIHSVRQSKPRKLVPVKGAGASSHGSLGTSKQCRAATTAPTGTSQARITRCATSTPS